ncbi:alkene reductase [Rhodococcus opacus]|uniref:1,2-oxophytodienoate reductase n=1 Tax=Rhodococcus opacus TaxID=37919 RepID=A0A076EYE3_RHOOP|nr:alkene reductase [Rhodococcus opacus]AII11000.1 1,2-oxophytodienoate reductase [Rhodococcus opacus]
MSTAFDPIDLAGTRLANRIAMAPMTRSRAFGPGASPTPAMAKYYAQRASAGLIVTEGTQPSAVGQGYPSTPGLHTDEQIAAWRPVTDAVHAAGGVIFAQLMHTGRIGHPSLLPDGLTPVGPSPVAAEGQVFTLDGMQDFVTPKELTEAEIDETIRDFAQAARNAIDAGFDGVEVHGANGYLLHQFLSTNANRRTDRWGQSIEGRIGFPLAVVRAVADAIGADRVGLRISPANPLNDIVEDGFRDTYAALVDVIEPIGLAYLHVMELGETADRELTLDLRKRFSGTFILNPSTPDAVTHLDELALVEDGTADMIAYGALFLANPDLPARLAAGGPFNTPDRATFYGGDENGYTDYPTLNG